MNEFCEIRGSSLTHNLHTYELGKPWRDGYLLNTTIKIALTP
jgi:hypothetical protein